MEYGIIFWGNSPISKKILQIQRELYELRPDNYLKIYLESWKS